MRCISASEKQFMPPNVIRQHQWVQTALFAKRVFLAQNWSTGLSILGRSSFGIALVAGRNRVPRPATGKTALRILVTSKCQFYYFRG